MDYTSLIKEINIPELVKALRYTQGRFCYGEGACPKNCELLMNHGCYTKLHMDAAAAIEDLQRELSLAEIAADDNGRQVEELQAEIRESMQRCAECSMWNEPKRGKWIRIDKHTIQCPLCRRYLDLRGVNAGRGDANYYPNCGADMSAKIETQDESISKFADGEWWKEARK